MRGITAAALALALVCLSGTAFAQEPEEITDSISRQLSLHNDPFFGPLVFDTAVSRELSLYNDPTSSGVEIGDVISRELSLFNDPLTGPVEQIDAISREISLYNDPLSPGVAITDVVSREVSVNNDPSVAAERVDVISREISVSNRPADTDPPETTITSGPADGSRVCPVAITFNFTGADAISPKHELSYRWRLDGGEWTEFSPDVSAALTGILSGQHAFEVAARDYEGNVDPTPATRTFVIDETPPAISGVSAAPASTQAVITWNTSEAATSLVKYGTTEALGSQSAFSASKKTVHSVTLTGLEPETKYYFQAVSEDGCGHEASSAIASFTTYSIIVPPLIEAIPDGQAVEGAVYTGPVPVLAQGAEPVEWSLVTGPAGMTIDPATGVVTWPIAKGSDVPYDVTIRATNGGGSDSESWKLTVDPTYTAVVATDTEIAPAGSPVLLSGSATRTSDSQPAANVPVSVVLQVKGTRRVLNAQTNALGNFQVIFSPLAREAGRYQAGAKHPGVTADPVQDEFVLVGMETEPASESLPIVPDVEFAGEAMLWNLGDTALSGISAQVVNKPPNLTVTVDTAPDLAPLGSASVAYTVFATGAQWTGTVLLRFTSSEGAVAEMPLTISVKPPVPELQASPTTLKTGMLRGTQTLYQFTVTNTGGATSGELSVDLPAAPWLSLASPSVIAPLAPGESASVVLSLTPAADAVLGPYSGTIAVGSGTSYAIQIPFEFTAISNGVGDLEVLAEDEFTYYAPSNPGVADALVTLANPTTGQVVATQTTDEDGRALFTDLTEAYYKVTVTADKHNSFESTVLVVSGQLTTLRAFLSRQLVTYNFVVSPVAVDDRYDIRLEAVFETNVPAPVITVDPGIVDLSAIEDSKQIDFTITNHGLIAAQDMTISFRNGGGFTVTPLVRNLGDLGAQQSVVVPVVFERETPEGPAAAEEDCSGPGLAVGYILICGVPHYYAIDVSLLFPSGECPGINVIPGGGGGSGITINPHVFPPSTTQPINCDPCDLARLKVLIGCVIDFIPIQPCIATLMGAKGCWDCAFDSNSDKFVCTLDCLGTGLNAADCVGRSVPFVGHIITTTKCLYNLYHACDDIPGAHQSARISVADATGIEAAVSTVEYVRIHADRLQAIAGPYEEIFGKTVWLEGVPEEDGLMQGWLEYLGTARDLAGDAGPRISSAELDQMLAMSKPSQVSADDVNAFAERWNRTMDYWESGIYDETQLPAGASPDFIAVDRLKAKYIAADAAINASLAEGFQSVYEGAKYATDVLRYEIERPVAAGVGTAEDAGICARVRLRIDQRAVISRTAFEAALELQNSGSSPIENLFVNIEVRDVTGQDATSVFSISAPALSVIDSVDGTGTLPAGQTGTAAWTILPTDDAAPDTARVYSVGGTLSYTLDGVQIDIPLFPSNITVLPNPSLHLKYFWQRDVFSDDPFTPDVEAAEPFSLGLIIQNLGAGEASNIRISTSQPEIIENEQGLLIDFRIIGTQVNTQQVNPSLNVSLGDLGPDETSVVRWLMTSTLQGKFISYEATFEHVDGLGDERLSLIDSLEIHELIHPVRIVDPLDDAKPDFLTNDLPDIQYVPETVHNSDGSVSPVTPVLNAATDGPVTPTDRQIILTATAPQGFMYLRVEDPGQDEYRLVRVLRSDGREIMLEDNVWTTHRTIRPDGQPAYREHRLHIFDCDSTGSYTLFYEPVSAETVLPGEAKMRPDGETVEIGAGTGVVVTGVFPDGFYVSALDRSSGIRVTGRQAAENDRVSVQGEMATAANGERVLAASSVSKLGTGSVEPLNSIIRALYGGDFEYDPVTGVGQQGMIGGAGPNMVGLLVSVTGRVTRIGVLSFTLSESEGSRSVSVHLPVGVQAPPVQSIVTVTGLVSCEKLVDGLLPVLRVRRASDVQAVTVGPVISAVVVTDITINSATVTWQTDVPSSTELRYGSSSTAMDGTVSNPEPVTAHSVELTGLDPKTRYYFVAGSTDPLTLITSQTPVQSFSTLDWGNVTAAKRKADGLEANLSAVIVTAVFDGFLYGQRPDRSGGGLRIVWDGSVTPGTAVEVSGTMGTSPDGERLLTATSVTDRGAYTALPVHLAGRALGGGPFFYEPLVPSGQMGLNVHEFLLNAGGPGPRIDMVGLSNVGLLVRISGRARQLEAGAFYLDDSSGYGDPVSSGVKVLLPAGASSPPEGTMMLVTGISSMYRGADGVYRLLLVPLASDIVQIQ